MTANNSPFNREYDLGVGEQYGVDRHAVSDSILHTALTHTPKCYVCSVTYPQYQVVPKEDKYITAQLQNGMYICFHCARQGVLDANKYGLRDLQ